MRVWIEYDNDAKVRTLFHEECMIDSAEAVETWRTQLISEFERRDDGRIPLLIDMKGVSIDPSMADAYGKTAHAVGARYASKIARYGQTEGLTLSTIRLQSIIKKHPANLYKDRESALAALRSTDTATD